MRTPLALLSLALVATSLAQVPFETEADRAPLFKTGGTVLIRHARVLTVTKGDLDDMDVLVTAGKITKIARNINIAGTRVVDATGLTLAPGIIDAHVHRGTDSTNEGTDSITCEVRIQDVLNPRAKNLWQAVASGETSGLILHGSANCVGGESLVAKFKCNRPPNELLIPDAPRMVKFALGENVTRSSSDNSARYPRTRMGVENVYRRAFIEARAYMNAWDAYNKNPNGMPPRKDIRLETLADILRRKVWVQCHSYRADEILMLLRLSQEFGFKIGAFQHALEAYKIAPELAAAGVGVSTFGDNWAYKVEAYDAIPYNAQMCSAAGIVTTINTDGVSGTTALNVDAAKTMHFGGATANEALAMLTINPAKVLGIDHRTGSIEVGKDADFVLWKGHPLSVYGRVEMTFIDGEVYFQRRDKWNVNAKSYHRDVLPKVAATESDPLPAVSSRYALVGGTVYPVSGPAIPNGTVLIENGKIKAVGGKVAVPSGFVKVNVAGKRVYPGFIDAGSTLGLQEIGSVSETNDTRELGDFNPECRAQVAMQIESAHLETPRQTGVLAALVSPSGGIVAGRSAVIDLGGFTWEQKLVRGDAGLAISFPGNSNPAPFEAELMCEGCATPRFDKDENHVHTGELPNEWADPKSGFQAQPPRVSSSVRPLIDFWDKAKKYASSGGTGDPKMDAMKPFVTGKAPLLLNVRSAASIRSALDFAEVTKAKIVLVGATESWKVADRIAKLKVPVILDPAGLSTLSANAPSADWMPYDTPYVIPSLLQKAGVKFAFQSRDNALSFQLPYRAGMSCAYGLSREDALRALTLSAAEILGVDGQLGSIAPGKLANLFVCDDDPFEPATSIRMAFVRGKPVELSSRFTRLRDRYLARLTPAQAAKVRR